MIRTWFLTLLLLGTNPAPAAAAWSLWSSNSSGPTLIEMSAPDSQNLFTTGVTIFMNGMTPTVTPYVLASSDGGESFRDITGNLSGGFLESPAAIFFANSQLGFVAVNKTLFKTIVGGTTWVSFDVGCTVRDLHFFDLIEGVATCPDGQAMFTSNGGMAWTPVATGVTSDLGRMFWVDRQNGWIATYDEFEGEDPLTDAPILIHENGVVLRTTDGGVTWSPSNTIDGLALSRLFFLNDGTHGWLAAWKFINEYKSEARLFATTDGGQTWSDTNLPLQVGTIEGFGSAPINLASIAVMHWSDANHGHLAGSAFVTSMRSTSGGAAPIVIWRTVSYMTSDGGSTWDKTDLGAIPIDISPGAPPPPSDGGISGGAMVGLHRGWMVGEEQAIWGYEHPCAGPQDCESGYACVAGECVLDTSCTPPCTGGQVCDQGTCVNPGNDDGGPQSGDLDSPPSDGPKEFQEEGCAAVPAGWVAWLLLPLGLWRGARRLRNAGKRLAGDRLG